jgi:hypothetical protein
MAGGFFRKLRSRSGDTGAASPTTSTSATSSPAGDMDPALFATLRDGLYPVFGGLVRSMRARLALVEAAGKGDAAAVEFNMGHMCAEFEAAKNVQTQHLLLKSPYDSPLLARLDSVFDRAIPMYEVAVNETKRGIEEVDVECLKHSQELVRAADATAGEANGYLRSLGIPVAE